MAMMLCAVLSAVLRGVLGALGLPMDGRAAAVMHGLLEIGGGAYDVSRAFESPAALLCGLCSFGGISILLQNIAFLGEEIRPMSLLLTRAAHGAISFGLCKMVLPMVTGGQSAASVAVSAFQPARTALSLWPLALLLVLASLRKSKTC
ncbi:MAG: hypothetical protein EOM69_09790 [Clostridia bacterium]|nr:hypothetical protein [Clostridia bacterium]